MHFIISKHADMIWVLHPRIYIGLRSREGLLGLGATGGPLVDMTTKYGMVMNQHQLPELILNPSKDTSLSTCSVDASVASRDLGM